MTSNKDDHDDLDTGMDGADDIMDVEGLDEPLSATPLGDADEFDNDGDDEYAYESDDERRAAKTTKKSGGMTKIVAPLLVLLVAAGAGGYIVMNPSILGGAPAQVAADVPVTPSAADTAMLPPPDMPAGAPPEMAGAETPPVAPETPVAEEIAVVAPEQPVAEVPVVAPDVAAPAVTPEMPVVEEKSVEVLAGSDVNVAPETVALQPETSPEATPVTPEPVPEIVPEVVPETAELTPPAPAAEAAPVVAPVPESPATPTPAPDVVATPDANVTEPTFVPAAPEGVSPVTEISPADAAAPPVMNVQEVTAVAPEMPPNAGAQAPSVAAPTAAGGQVSAPITPLPTGNDSDVYYDSLAQVPSGAMATSVGPREVNPVLEPASKMIIVSKDRGENSAEALLVSANRALKLKRYDSALEMFDQLYAKNKRDVRILMGRAIAQQNMGLNESAIQSYEEILKLKPDNTEALVNMMGLVRSQYPEVALRRLLDLYSEHPNNAGIAAQIGITNAGLGHFDDAMRYLGIASTLEPQNAQHLFNMAVAADRNGKRAQAVELYERALEVDVMYGASRSVPRERIYDRLSILRRG